MPGPEHRPLLDLLEGSLAGQVPMTWRRRLDGILPGESYQSSAWRWGSLAMLLGPLAPASAPALAFVYAAARRERGRARWLFAAQQEHARALLSSLCSSMRTRDYRDSAAAPPLPGSSVGARVAGCVGADRLVLVHATGHAPEVKGGEVFHDGVAGAALFGDGGAILLFAVWAEKFERRVDWGHEREPALGHLLTEAKETLRGRLPIPVTVEYWSWRRGELASLEVSLE